eukprot:GILK01004701.1.p1 GENE.GILK01004701.1~~GILK01004701.1.p1  ORF type:complete len:359 (+),score=38.03 GILK01004701.1:129-1079(+)
MADAEPLPKSDAADEKLQRIVCTNVKCNRSDSSQWKEGWEMNGQRVPLCNACGIRFSKGSFCPWCYQIYKENEPDESEENPWLGCDYCPKWVHLQCELDNSKLSKVDSKNYRCPECVKKGITKRRASADSLESELATQHGRRGRPPSRITKFRVPLTPSLKDILVVDWEAHREDSYSSSVLPLPRTPTVTQILQDYQSTKLQSMDENIEDKDTKAVVDGLKYYFQKALPKVLLYRCETAQLNAPETDTPTDFCEVYGAEHLLRLLVKLPTLFEKSDVSTDLAKPLVERLSDVVKFLDEHASDLFAPTYVAAVGIKK